MNKYNRSEQQPFKKAFQYPMTQNKAEQDVTDDSDPVEYVDIVFVQSVSNCTEGTDCYKIFRLHLFWNYSISSDNTWYYPRLSFQSCNYDIFGGWCLHSSWRLHFYFSWRRNILASGWRRHGQRRSYSRTLVPPWLLETPFSSCVLSIIDHSWALLCIIRLKYNREYALFS